MNQKITRVKTSFQQTIKGVNNLISINKPVNLAVEISEMNKYHILDVLKHHSNYLVKSVLIAWKIEDIDETVLNSLKQGVELLERNNITVKLRNIPESLKKGFNKELIDDNEIFRP